MELDEWEASNRLAGRRDGCGADYELTHLCSRAVPAKESSFKYEPAWEEWPSG